MNNQAKNDDAYKRFVCYVIFRGRRTGIFKTWKKVKPQIAEFKNAYYRGFYSKNAAKRALTNYRFSTNAKN